MKSKKGTVLLYTRTYITILFIRVLVFDQYKRIYVIFYICREKKEVLQWTKKIFD